MKRMLTWTLLLLGALALTAGATYSQDEATSPKLAVTLDQAYVGKYMWRGIVVNPDPAYQPSLTIAGANGLSFNFWGSLDTTNVSGNSGRLTEIDYTLDYEFQAGKLPMNVGVIDYTFPNTDFASTAEVYAATSLDLPLAPSAKLYYDFVEADGFYLSLGCSHTAKLPMRGKANEVNLCANLGAASGNYNSFYFGVSDASLVDLTLGVSVPITSGNITWTPSLNFSTLIGSKLREAVADPDNLFLGVTASYGF